MYERMKRKVLWTSFAMHIVVLVWVLVGVGPRSAFFLLYLGAVLGYLAYQLIMGTK